MVLFMMQPRVWGFVIASAIALIALFVGFLALTRPQEGYVRPAALSQASTSSDTAPSTTPMVSESGVEVDAPLQNQHAGHTFTVSGKAPGPWFFEAQFPMMVRAQNGTVVGRATAKAKGNWQTTGTVAFETVMQIDATYNGPATLVLLKDNPSGLPQNDDSVEVPIIVD